MKIITAFQLLAIWLLTSCMATNDLYSASVIAGGYQAVAINNEIKAAALFAIQTQTKRENKAMELLEISNAKQQVVAGMNYQFELTVKSGETLYHATVVVFRSLNATYQLTSWQWLPVNTGI